MSWQCLDDNPVREGSSKYNVHTRSAVTISHRFGISDQEFQFLSREPSNKSQVLWKLSDRGSLKKCQLKRISGGTKRSHCSVTGWMFRTVNMTSSSRWTLLTALMVKIGKLVSLCAWVHLKISVTSDFLWKVNVILGAYDVSLVIDTNERALICYATDRRLFLQNSRRGNVILAHLLTKESLVLHSCFSDLGLFGCSCRGIWCLVSFSLSYLLGCARRGVWCGQVFPHPTVHTGQDCRKTNKIMQSSINSCTLENYWTEKSDS